MRRRFTSRGVPMNMTDLDLRMEDDREQIGDALCRLLTSSESCSQEQRNHKSNAILEEAMRYATLGAGKRIRPLLALRVARLLGTETKFVFRAALAVELLHCASLVIDDLPCMDNAAFRRGKAAVHVRFGEPKAILAAFSLVALGTDAVMAADTEEAWQLLRLMEFQRRISQALGCNSLSGGQAWDLELKNSERSRNAELLATQKTAPLFELAARAGMVSSQEREEKHQAMLEFAKEFGVLFQLINDTHENDTQKSDLFPHSLLQKQITRVRGSLDKVEPTGGELTHLAERMISYRPEKFASYLQDCAD